ncbi:TIGR03086 family metal-binding protein [Amycolatopsis alkalitolerans]|uniref:TIGR03086 family protein n=1 Tax=Amycolatopsis alkalitolerans TaxID=2547244 RepID=A0A5C4LUK0_9PSEU|nr:TIGR03086 family metal-binding protein [Amycolatopsis alkalitolerans]TNC18857.1 TIGR03086 family protein [Amycolatopsis alkalitolerans]
MIDQGAAALLGGVGLLERAVNYTLGSLHLVTAARLPRPTPCQDWTLHELLAHMDDSLRALSEAADLGQVGLDVPAPGRGDPVTALKNRACHLLAAWCAAEAPGAVEVGDRTLTTGILTGAGAVEVAVHGWDVAQACGDRRPIPEPLAEELLELAPFFVTGEDRPVRFGPPRRVSPLAGASDRLLAFVGRDPDRQPNC